MSIIRPSSDILTGWTSTGANSYGVIDEVTADNADYISASSAGLITRVGLGSTTDPGVNTGHVLRYRADHDTSDGRGVIAKVVQTGSFPFIVTSKQPWRSQPQVPVFVNTSMFGSEKCYLWSATQLGNPTYGGKRLGLSGVAHSIAGGHRVFSTDGVTYNNIDFSAVANIPPPWSYIIRLRRRADQTDARIHTLTSGTDNAVISFNVGGSGSLDILDSGYAWESIGSMGNVLPVGEFRTLVITMSSLKDVKAYSNGVYVGGTSITATTFLNLGGASFIGGQYSGYGAQVQFDISELALLSNDLSEINAKQISKDIYGALYLPRTLRTYVDLGRKVIAERTPSLTTSPADYTIDLSEAEAATITDYSALAIEVEST